MSQSFIKTTIILKNLPRKTSNFTPAIISRKFNKYRVIKRNNIIPYSASNYNRKDWYEYYYTTIEDMYRITRLIIDKKFPKNKIDWDNPRYYTGFIKLIYESSSKYIPILRG